MMDMYAQIVWIWSMIGMIKVWEKLTITSLKIIHFIVFHLMMTIVCTHGFITVIYFLYSKGNLLSKLFTSRIFKCTSELYMLNPVIGLGRTSKNIYETGMYVTIFHNSIRHNFTLLKTIKNAKIQGSFSNKVIHGYEVAIFVDRFD